MSHRHEHVRASIETQDFHGTTHLWGDLTFAAAFVADETMAYERDEITHQTGLRPNISWRFRVATKIRMAHTPRKTDEPLTHSNIHAVY